MIGESMDEMEPRLRAAVVELQELIYAHYPTTTFTVGVADDPDGVHMRAVVDGDDTDEVIAVFLDRLVDFQVKDDLPIYVVPVRTPERIAASYAAPSGHHTHPVTALPR